MKYIDSEKMKAEIKRRINELEHDKYLSVDSKTARIAELHFIDRRINSLQQEQESVAERFARIVRGNLIGIDKRVQEKFEQLYVEVTGNKMYGGFND